MDALTVRVATDADAGRLPPLFDALSHPAAVNQLGARLVPLSSTFGSPGQVLQP